MASAKEEVAAGTRFPFGENWTRFLRVLSEERIVEAERSLRETLQMEDLSGKTFLDIGSGSGLFSLAARRLGATVYSFDFDLQSVECTRELKRRFFPDDEGWTISEGSVLDEEYVESLGHYDIVYSWGVLMMTGRMWNALDIAQRPVAPDGRLFMMVYLDRGWLSDFWRIVKRLYCSGTLGRWLVLGTFIPYNVAVGFVADMLRLRNPVKRYTEYKKRRGMSKLYDYHDWLGGLPYEVATPKEIIDFYEARGFRLLKHQGTEFGYVECVFQRE